MELSKDSRGGEISALTTHIENSIHCKEHLQNVIGQSLNITETQVIIPQIFVRCLFCPRLCSGFGGWVHRKKALFVTFKDFSFEFRDGGV